MQTAYLEIKDTKGARQVPLDGGPLTIGRNFTNLLVIDEPMSSRFHCVIERAADGFHLRDLESRNGTLLNGKPVRQSVMASGDVITIGKTEIKLVVPAVRPASRQPTKATADTAMAELATLVGDEEESDDEAEPAPETIVSANEYERQLRERAEVLTDRTFTDRQIALINARGKLVYPADPKKDVGEAINILRLVMLVCFRSRATDIHVEPRMDDVQVRIRVDGTMIDVVRLSKELGVKLLSAVKVLSDIDIAQRGIVQEGHFSARVPTRVKKEMIERRVDYRVSFAPAMHGQKLVVRVLDTANAPLHIDDLELPAKAREIIRRTSEQDAGMILVCGPTGSGKTTTLYAILRDIDISQRNVVTIEDPVEIQLDGVTQIPVNDAQGNSFSALLRSVLRQDPDVILVGEIRDAETARVAVQAGMTGHLVFSTVHSRETISGMFRLLDLGVEPYVVASGLHVVVAQRLVRQLCPHCKVAKPPTADQLKKFATFGITGVKQVFQPKGCKKCFGTGHFGRRGVFEILVATPKLRDAMLKSPTIEGCRSALSPDNYITLEESGYRLIAEGAAGFDEVEKTIA
ncbi:MAG TPA: ATPase, T2SS/T4P/T4SS family [Tepidisphaeraceae bacterium]|jgi:general secretion pathway protein E|nr:ATPase, T2SS/T4P/T4SS family [Tepidisphaeraceae bacterium]